MNLRTDMKKGATLETHGIWIISGLRKDWPNIIKIFPYLNYNKMSSVIIRRENFVIQSLIRITILAFGFVLDTFYQQIIWPIIFAAQAAQWTINSQTNIQAYIQIYIQTLVCLYLMVPRTHIDSPWLPLTPLDSPWLPLNSLGTRRTAKSGISGNLKSQLIYKFNH